MLADSLDSAEREEPRSEQSCSLPTSPALCQRGVQGASESVGAALMLIQAEGRRKNREEGISRI